MHNSIASWEAANPYEPPYLNPEDEITDEEMEEIWVLKAERYLDSLEEQDYE